MSRVTAAMRSILAATTETRGIEERARGATGREAGGVHGQEARIRADRGGGDGLRRVYPGRRRRPHRQPAPAPATAASASRHRSQPPASRGAAATVRLQLQWTPQAQFAGYFAADKQGYFKAENLTVNMVAGRPDGRPPGRGSKADGPEFTISWVPKVLEAREAASLRPRRHRPGLPALRHAVGDLEGHAARPTRASFAGKKVGVWDFGNEFEVTAGLLPAA